MKIHVCLVSAQATPNLTPTLDDALKPERVVLVTSTDMRMQAGHLGNVLKRRGLKVEQLDIADAYDYAAIEDALLDWLSRHEEEEVALNVTGGTKLMAMAAQSVFAGNGKPIFYVNAETDDIIFLGRRDLTRRLPERIKLRDYLEAHGYALEGKPARPEIPAALRETTDRLIDRVQSAGSALGQLNWLAQQARNDLAAPLPEQRQRDKHLADIIDLFEEAKLLARRQDRLVFPDEAARQFANGGWLEFHVYRTLAELAPEMSIADHAINLCITHPDGKTRNELDAVFLHRNRLHIIEAKAANLSASGAGNDSKATEAIYKLETLLKIGGLRTRAMLVDYRGRLNDTDKARASEAHIQIVSAAQLKNLKGELRRWLGNSR